MDDATLTNIAKMYMVEKYGADTKNLVGKSIQNILNKTPKKVLNANSYYISFSIIITFICIFTYSSWLSFKIYARSNFNKYKCDPRTMLVSGYIKPKDGKTEFESNNEYVQECVEPIVRHIATYKNTDIMNNINSDKLTMSKLTGAAGNLMNKVSELKNQISDSLNSFSLKNNNKNTEQQKLNYYLLDIGKKQEALVNTVGTKMLGIYISTQSGLTYVYNFFEGALVLLTILIISLVITGGSLIALSYACSAAAAFAFFMAPFFIALSIILFALGAACLITAFAFFCLFLAVVIMMLLYAGFLKEVFGIRVNSRKTKTPNSPM